MLRGFGNERRQEHGVDSVVTRHNLRERASSREKTSGPSKVSSQLRYLQPTRCSSSKVRLAAAVATAPTPRTTPRSTPRIVRTKHISVASVAECNQFLSSRDLRLPRVQSAPTLHHVRKELCEENGCRGKFTKDEESPMAGFTVDSCIEYYHAADVLTLPLASKVDLDPCAMAMCSNETCCSPRVDVVANASSCPSSPARVVTVENSTRAKSVGTIGRRSSWALINGRWTQAAASGDHDTCTAPLRLHKNSEGSGIVLPLEKCADLRPTDMDTADAGAGGSLFVGADGVVGANAVGDTNVEFVALAEEVDHGAADHMAVTDEADAGAGTAGAGQPLHPTKTGPPTPQRRAAAVALRQVLKLEIACSQPSNSFSSCVECLNQSPLSMVQSRDGPSPEHQRLLDEWSNTIGAVRAAVEAEPAFAVPLDFLHWNDKNKPSDTCHDGDVSVLQGQLRDAEERERLLVEQNARLRRAAAEQGGA